MRRKREETDMMEKYEIQKLRDLPIEEVAEQLGMEVKRHKSLCPFHDDHHASFSFNAGKNICRCFVCMKEAIGTIDLVMRILNLDFPKACHWLADKNDIFLNEGKTGEGRVFRSASSSGQVLVLHPERLPPALLPSMPTSTGTSSSIPGSTWRPEGFSSRRGRLMREWLHGAD